MPLDFLKNVQQQAVQLLEHTHTPPQRYGTAFHLSPPVTDVRELPVPLAQRVVETVAPKMQQDILRLTQHDPYALWYLAHAHQQVIRIPAQQRSKIFLAEAGVIWIMVEENAELEIQDELLEQDTLIRRVYIWQEANSRVAYTALRAKNKFLTEECHVFLQGAHAQLTMTHLAYGNAGEQSDIEVAAYHQAPSTTSTISFRAAAEEKNVTMYRGLIKVENQALGSKGYQQGRGLILGKRAVVDMLPELEIKTNDVQCSHGVTTTHLDDSSLFYSRSRGIEKKDARRLAMNGFYHHQLDIPEDMFKKLQTFYA